MNFWKSKAWERTRRTIGSIDQHLFTPKRGLIFRPLATTPLHKVKVVLLGVEPSYRSDGFAYSSNDFGIENAPLSNRLLIHEAVKDVSIPLPQVTSLLPWAQNGVLLWNAFPTSTTQTQVGHYYMEWDVLTDDILQSVYNANPDAVFVAIERHAQAVLAHALPSDAMILEVPAIGARNTVKRFHGCRMFSRINRHLRKTQQGAISWKLK